MKLKILLSAFVLSLCTSLHGVELQKDSLLSDFDTLVKVIKDTHPDPYSNYGGRVFFYKKAADFRNNLLKDSGLNVGGLYERAAEFMSLLQDGHSFISPPMDTQAGLGADSLLLVKFMYADGSLVVNAIDSVSCHLLGSRLIAINGIPVKEITDRVARYYPCENQSGRYGFLSDYFRTLNIYRKLVEDKSARLIFDLVTPAGDSVSYSPVVINTRDFSKFPKARVPESDRFPSHQMEWRDVDGTMFFRLSIVMSRENFEFQYNNGWDFYDQLKGYYRMTGNEMPLDTLAAIKAVPSMSESFLDMLSDMKSKGIKKLVIDLRGNGGGWTPVTLPTLYMMYGDDYLETDMSSSFYRRVSDFYLKKINSSIEDFNRNNGTDLSVGDYLIPFEGEDNRSISQKRDDFLNQAFCTDRVKEELGKLKGEPVYRPENVYVVTDNSTFSAAFHYAFYLSKMGAIVAGETSSQAPNCYMEVTPFTLPYSGLTGSVSNSMQVFLLANDPKSKEFTPAVRLTYDDYRRYNFDRNSILLHLLQVCRDNP